MKISVCIGSSCHRRGSYQIHNEFKRLVNENSLDGSVEVVSAFCFDNCGQPVNIMIDEKLISGVCIDNVEDIFNTYVIQKICLK